MLTIALCILFGLAAGDIITFSTLYLNDEFSGKKVKKSAKKRSKKIVSTLMDILRRKGEWKTTLKYCAPIYLNSIFVTITIVNIFGLTIEAAAALIFAYGLIILTFVDLKTGMLPDVITKPLIAIGILQGACGLLVDFQDSIVGAFIGYFLLWTINTAFKLLRNKEGMGYGDFKLLSAIGAWVGALQLPLVILFSSLLGVFVALAISTLPNRKISQPTAFGPSLALAGFVSLCWGREIMAWYVGMF